MLARPAAQAPPWLLPLLVVLLLMSGICGLIYQVLWLRLLALTFGVTVHAAATVLASFMGGLALGSLVAGRLADRSTSPLRLFGFVEVSIGLFAVASPVVLSGLQSAFVRASPYLPESVFVGSLIRVVLSFLVLLVPTALMGATMPIVIKSSLARMEGLGARAGLLYAANTGGAIAGALLAGFYLIPRLGLSRGFLFAAAINTTVGLLAITASRWLPKTSVAPDQAASSITQIPPPASDRAALVVLAVAGVSGFASLALEVVWFRVLTIFLGPTSYTFTVMLAAVLTGIAIGSALAAPLLRWRRLDWMQALALLQFAGAALILGSFTGILAPGDAPVWLHRALASAGIEFAVGSVAMSLTVVLPASLFFGMAFPIGLRLWAGAEGHAAETGRRVGLFYSVNVGGGILGSLLAGFLLLPVLGSRASLILLAALYVGAGIALQLLCAPRRPLLTGLMTAGLVALMIQASGVPDPLEIIHRRIYAGRPVVWQDEGMQTTVAVVGGTNNRVLFLDGRHQANDSPGMTFIHRRIGLLPVVLHERPLRALVVGLGGGATPGAMSQFPGTSVDVIELSRGVIDAAAYFGHINFDIRKNPNVHIRLDDGRNFLQRVRTPYDVITADAIIPRHAGANSLNSVEYFRLVRGALAPQGIALHWNGGATEPEYQLILRAFVAAFPHTTLWGDGSLMVGTLEPLTLSRSRIESLLAAPQTRSVLGLMNVETFDHLERVFRASTADIRAYLGEGPLLSDDRPLLEYFASLPTIERDLTKIGRQSGDLIRP
ncbi:MAG: fused MFS/spermidine synthase [Acidobacteria bacterium]|nr:fused MFS/spermidine synthase [Acidobacteriota bacterium]